MSSPGSSTPLTHGRTLREARLAGLCLTETAHGSCFEIPAHAHSKPAITFVLGGEFEEIFGRRRLLCRRWEILFKPAGASHSNRYGLRGSKSFLMTFCPAELAWAQQEDFDREPQRLRGSLAVQALEVYRAFRAGEETLPLHAEELIGVLRRRSSPRTPRRVGANPTWLTRVRDQIRDDPAAAVSLSSLARSAGVHPVHLARSFRLWYDCSIGDYVRRCRIDRATHLLADGNLETSAIALDCGFCDQSHFSRVFKRETGRTPAKFRRELRSAAAEG